MASLGIITGQEIKKNRNGEADVRLLQVEFSNQRDIRTVQYMPMSGDDSPPQNGDQVAVFGIGPAFLFAIGLQDSVVPSMGEGEKKLYSRDSSGDIAAFINFLAGGDLELNGNNRSAVGYEDLLAEFNELKTVVNTHTHIYTPGVGTPTPTATALPQSAADITTTEVPTVKVP